MHVQRRGRCICHNAPESPSELSSLTFDMTTGLRDDNLKRLLQVNTLQYLSLPLLSDTELALLVFSSKVKSLNAFYRGSVGLVAAPPLKRPSLVATALVKRASKNFQYSSLLLSNYFDASCEIVRFAKLDELDGDDRSSQPIQDAMPKQRRLPSFDFIRCWGKKAQR